MPATTPTYGLPYPEGTDPTNVPLDMQELALEVEAEITRVDGLISAGPLIKACRVYHNANQAIASGSFAPLTFNSERFDTDTMHSTVTNPGRITFTTAGLYLIGGCVEFAPSAVGTRGLGLLLNGATYIASVFTDIDSATAHGLAISTVYAVTAGQWVEMWAGQTSGGALNVMAGPSYSPEFYATRLGRVV